MTSRDKRSTRCCLYTRRLLLFGLECGKSEMVVRVGNVGDLCGGSCSTRQLAEIDCRCCLCILIYKFRGVFITLIQMFFKFIFLIIYFICIHTLDFTHRLIYVNSLRSIG